jgi:hypothetical protein
MSTIWGNLLSQLFGISRAWIQQTKLIPCNFIAQYNRWANSLAYPPPKVSIKIILWHLPRLIQSAELIIWHLYHLKQQIQLIPCIFEALCAIALKNC